MKHVGLEAACDMLCKRIVRLEGAIATNALAHYKLSLAFYASVASGIKTVCMGGIERILRDIECRAKALSIKVFLD